MTAWQNALDVTNISRNNSGYSDTSLALPLALSLMEACKMHSMSPKLAAIIWGPEVTKLFLCSTQLSMKFVLLINVKLLTIANLFLLNIAVHENFSANKYAQMS